MSAPLAGKFQDHYTVLGIEPKSDSETIQRAYAKLAQKYRPSNAMTGDPEMFEAVNTAYETLSDPELRSIFDKLRGVGQDVSVPKFSGYSFFDALGREAIRHCGDPGDARVRGRIFEHRQIALRPGAERHGLIAQIDRRGERQPR